MCQTDIFSICLALEMSHPETDKALFLYGMLPLSDFDIREKLLIQALTDHIGFSETNRLLKKAGLNPLEIEKTKQTTGPHIIREPMEEFVRISGPTYSYGDFVGDCSLSGLHYPGSYAFDGEMILQDKSGMKDSFSRFDRLILNDLCHKIRERYRQIIRPWEPKRDRQARLWIRVHEKDFLSFLP